MRKGRNGRITRKKITLSRANLNLNPTLRKALKKSKTVTKNITGYISENPVITTTSILAALGVVAASGSALYMFLKNRS